MKRFCIASALVFCLILSGAVAQDSDVEEAVQPAETQETVVSESEDPIVQQFLASENGEEAEKEESSYVKKEKIYPEPKRPRVYTQDEIQKVVDAYPDHNDQEYIDNCNDTFKYGIRDQIIDALKIITQEEDVRFADVVYDLFEDTKIPAVKEQILEYFTKLKDPCIEDFAVGIINDPYDERKTIVDKCFQYVSAVKSTSSVPGVVELIDKEDESYFNGALAALGDVGGDEEAVFIAEYLDRDDLTTAQRQSLMKVLGKLKAVSTYDKMAEIVQNEDEDKFVRMYAAEAIGAMEIEEAEDILVEQFEDDDPNIRAYVIKGIAHFNDQKATDILIQGLRDTHYKVRLEAVEAVESHKLLEAVPYLIFRCKDKSENALVRNKCYDILAGFNTPEGNEYLVGLITDTKTGDSTKTTVAKALLKYGFTGTSEIIDLAKKTLENDIHKQLRYNLGKEFAKYGKPEFESICADYLAHKEVFTQGTGLDIYAKGKYAALEPKVRAIAESDNGKRKNSNAKKAKKILGIKDEAEAE